MPLRVRLVVVAATVAGAATVGGASLAGHGPVSSPATFAMMVALLAATWLWPLLLYRGVESEAVHFDEALFVVMALLLPPRETILVFALATVVAQLGRRQPAVKLLFNFGQTVTAVGLAVAVVEVLAAPQERLTPVSVAAACAGAVVFFFVSTCAVTTIVSASEGARFFPALADGAASRLRLMGAGVGVGAVTALAVSSYSWAMVLVGLPLVILRQVLAGHFAARHDRERMEGLFKATVEANRSMGADDIEASLRSWSARLLRSSEAQIVDHPPTIDGLSALLPTGRQNKWLVASGRRKSEPFDPADQSLLDALAAVGAGALANADLYGEVHRQQQQLATITSALGEGVCAVDAEGRITFANPVARKMLGFTAEPESGDGQGQESLPVLGPSFIRAAAVRAMGSGTTIRLDETLFNPSAGEFPVAFTCSPVLQEGAPAGAVLVLRDITERKALEERLSHYAFHDPLTGLPNRRVFLDRLDHALVRSRRDSMGHAVLFADVDRFKVVNDNVGHLGGDHLLVAIASRLSSVLRPGDTLARFGGDEFTLLLEDVGDEAAVASIARRILSTLDTPIVLPTGHEVVATLSMGIALTAGQDSADDILHNADVAMYQAKSRGMGQCEIFDSRAMGARSVERVEIESALRRGVLNDEIEVYYQPIYTVDRAVVGAEALVRWRHPTRGLLGPGEFIGVAEETGIILRLGSRVLEAACEQARRWSERTSQPLSVSVNLSARQFSQPDLTAQIVDVLWRTGLDPNLLCLEITESVAMQDLDRTIKVLHELKGLGVRLALDDFGTGHSSLNYLKRFPVDIVKLDRGFVGGLETSAVDAAIIGAVVSLAGALGITIVAEGVETAGQLDRLRALGCPLLQGYLMAKPMPGDEFQRLVCDWTKVALDVVHLEAQLAAS